MLTRLRLGFIHFLKNKFRYGFKDTLNPLLSNSIEAETAVEYTISCAAICIIQTEPP